MGGIKLNNNIQELITRRRMQLTVHSFLYYQLSENIIDDYTFDLWSKELVDLQCEHPGVAAECIFPEEFKKFDGSTGFDLPYHYPNIQAIGYRLLKMHKEKTGL